MGTEEGRGRGRLLGRGRQGEEGRGRGRLLGVWDLTSSCLQCNGCSDSPVIGDAILLQLLQPTPQG